MVDFSSPSMQSIDQNHRSLSTKRYMSLWFDGIFGCPNIIPNDIRKHLSKFSGNHTVSTSQHVQVFSVLMGDYEIAHEDVHIKLFVQTLEGDARD